MNKRTRVAVQYYVMEGWACSRRLGAPRRGRLRRRRTGDRSPQERLLLGERSLNVYPLPEREPQKGDAAATFSPLAVRATWSSIIQ